MSWQRSWGFPLTQAWPPPSFLCMGEGGRPGHVVFSVDSVPHPEGFKGSQVPPLRSEGTSHLHTWARVPAERTARGGGVTCASQRLEMFLDFQLSDLSPALCTLLVLTPARPPWIPEVPRGSWLASPPRPHIHHCTGTHWDRAAGLSESDDALRWTIPWTPSPLQTRTSSPGLCPEPCPRLLPALLCTCLPGTWSFRSHQTTAADPGRRPLR